MARRTAWRDATVRDEIEKLILSNIVDPSLREAAIKWLQRHDIGYRVLENMVGKRELQKMMADVVEK